MVGTSIGAIYIYDQKNFIPWNLSLSRQLRGQELNCAIYSAKRNTYYLGTQLSGIYEVDTHGNILNHFSTANILLNNTVLSLYEDNQNNIWVALDRGLAYIRYTDGLSYYRSTDGGFGGIYDATIWHDNLLIGTNQGIYYTRHDKLNDLYLFSIDGCLQGAEDSCIDAIRVTDMEIGKNFQQSVSMCAEQPSVYFTEGPYLPLSALYQWKTNTDYHYL